MSISLAYGLSAAQPQSGVFQWGAMNSATQALKNIHSPYLTLLITTCKDCLQSLRGGQAPPYSHTPIALDMPKFSEFQISWYPSGLGEQLR